MKVGLEVITGFLGAGKSAFINSYIEKTIIENEKIVVITMENGNVKIQKQNKNVNIININKECCDLVENILLAIEKYSPNRIIIEVNGTENLEQLYKWILSKEISKVCKLYTSYYICDGYTIEFFIKNMGELLIPYIENCDVIIISNSREVNEDATARIKLLLESINNKAHILSSINNNFNTTLDNSGLLEKSYVRKFRVSTMNYISKI